MTFVRKEEREQFERIERLLLDLTALLALYFEVKRIPTTISVTWSHREKGAIMADITLTGVESTTGTITLLDATGAIVAGDAIDAGTLFVTFADGSEFTIAPGTDTTSFTITSTGAAVSGDVLTVSGSFNGVALAPFTQTFDVIASAPTSIAVAFSAPVAG